ncbi:hypothetical protein BDY21DRAFT_345483 [Lineolata rhizophorae]|uniref:Uncharacterized protein n=1 Tax=Lineolata rhizophorae TaxID=578093 RepID=A0A6A6P0K8_9PEZI|nr:hypothetical protein BDY21DRAFT_345483 [Lineolata rhizophorae]
MALYCAMLASLATAMPRSAGTKHPQLTPAHRSMSVMWRVLGEAIRAVYQPLYSHLEQSVFNRVVRCHWRQRKQLRSGINHDVGSRYE